jgi:hypothetical protein
VPDGVVTTTSTAPAAWAGVVTETCELSVTERAVPGLPPNVTAVAPVKLAPEIVVAVPPVIGPVVGAMTVGVTSPARAERSAMEASGSPPAPEAAVGLPWPMGAQSVFRKPGTWAGLPDQVVVEIIAPGHVVCPAGSSAEWSVTGSV